MKLSFLFLVFFLSLGEEGTHPYTPHIPTCTDRIKRKYVVKHKKKLKKNHLKTNFSK